MKRSSNQKGSAFILILVAIALFGALSYAVMRGGSQSMSKLSEDQARLAARDIIAYGDAMVKAVQTLRLRGCSDAQLNFANTIWKNSDNSDVMAVGHNPLAVDGCSVFLQGEGNLAAKTFPANYFATTNTTLAGSSRVRTRKFLGIGSDTESDLLYFLPHLKPEICLMIDQLLGFSIESLPEYALTGTELDYAGVYNTSTGINDDPDGALAGKSSYCATNTNSAPPNNNRFYTVLIAR